MSTLRTTDSSWVPCGGGTSGEMIRALDWSTTPLGAIGSWPISLRVTVQNLLSGPHPQLLFWGPEFVQIFNDGFMSSLGAGELTTEIGQPGPESWAEVWPIILPQLTGVLETGIPTWFEDAMLPIFRNGRLEEVFWTYGHSAVRNDDGVIEGVAVACIETTSGVLANRRLHLAAELVECASEAESPGKVITNVLACLPSHAHDLPFAAAFDRNRQLIGSSGLDEHIDEVVRMYATSPALADVDAPTLSRLDAPFVVAPWPEPVTEIFAIPLELGTVLIFGLSPRLPFDEDYREFVLQLVTAVDVAQAQTAAELERRAVERERQDLLMQAPVATAVIEGPDYHYTLANDLYLEMVGREVRGRPYFEAFPELVGSPMVEILASVYSSGLPFATEELSVPLTRNGTTQDAVFKFNLEPIRRGDGGVYGMMVLAVEITEMVASREARARVHAELERSHEERAELIGKLETASRAKDEFLAMLGHELRNPLAPIVTALELINLDPAGDITRRLALIGRQVGHLVRLVDDLLDVARIARGKVELKKEDCDIGVVVSKAIEMAGPVIESRRHRLSVEVDAPMPWWGDPVRLAQVVANLLTNAARYTPLGGEIQVAASTRDDEIQIRVTDNGNGIEAARIEQIFDMFVQGTRKTDRAEGGLGLGLALVKNLVEGHGGQVTAISEGLGQGSTFEVSLPITRESGNQEPDAAAPQVGAKQVLVVDDNSDAAEMLATLLRTHGHNVTVVFDPLSAIEIIERTTLDLGIFDIGLPGMDGYELARRVRAIDRAQGMRLIAVSGYGQRHDRERSAAAGFEAHLVKPIAFNELVKLIAEA